MPIYVTNSEADIYFENRPFSDLWNSADETKKTNLLLLATKLIDDLNFIGSRHDDAQGLEFPRGVDTEYPESIMNACCEIAYAVLGGRDIEYEHELMGSKLASNEVGRMAQDPGTVNIAKLHNIPSVKAWSYLRPFLRDGSVITFSRIR